MSTTFFGSEVAVLSAGDLLPFGERHEDVPVIHIDLSLLCRFRVIMHYVCVLKLANY